MFSTKLVIKKKEEEKIISLQCSIQYSPIIITVLARRQPTKEKYQRVPEPFIADPG